MVLQRQTAKHAAVIRERLREEGETIYDIALLVPDETLVELAVARYRDKLALKKRAGKAQNAPAERG